MCSVPDVNDVPGSYPLGIQRVAWPAALGHDVKTTSSAGRQVERRQFRAKREPQPRPARCLALLRQFSSQGRPRAEGAGLSGQALLGVASARWDNATN